MAQNSFDIEAGVDRQEVDNAINQAAREVATRFDFKGTDTQVRWEGEGTIRIASSTEDRVKAAVDVLKEKLVKRKVSLKALDVGDVQPAAGGSTRLDITLTTTLPPDLGKQIVKQIKQSKIKVNVTNMGDHIRVAGKSRDDLQEVIQLVRAQDYPAPLRFTNYT